MDRRTHIKQMAGLTGAMLLGSPAKPFSTADSPVTDGKIITVTGEVSPSELGITLPHEHIFATFSDKPERYPTYPEKDLLDTVIPYFKKLKKLGIGTIVDARSAYFGRHPEYLKRISEETEIHIITNTGYYGGAKGQYIPKHVAEETAQQVAQRWMREISRGIDETGIYPGIIKTAIEHRPMLDVDKKLIKAAAIAHKNTGLPIQSQIGNNLTGANNMISLLSDENVSIDAWTFVHAHLVPNASDLVPIAKMDGYLSYDGLNEDRAEKFLGDFKLFKTEGVFNRILLSHSGSVFNKDDIEANYHFLVTDFKTRFLAYGFDEKDFKQITETNPANALTVKKRLL